MSEINLEVLESELARLRPARPPVDFVARVASRLPGPRSPASIRGAALVQPAAWWRLMRWLAPAGAVAGVLAVLLLRNERAPTHMSSGHATPPPAQSTLKVDNVEIDHRLITAFDTVALLPSGEPVRFRCREWLDAVVLRDSGQDVSIEQSAPRVEIVPVRFEVY